MIYIQGNIEPHNNNNNTGQLLLNDIYMIKKAVQKYYIVIGNNNLVNSFIFNGWLRHKLADLAHPMMRINHDGLKTLKCPTVSGTAKHSNCVISSNTFTETPCN